MQLLQTFQNLIGSVSSPQWVPAALLGAIVIGWLLNQLFSRSYRKKSERELSLRDEELRVLRSDIHRIQTDYRADTQKHVQQQAALRRRLSNVEAAAEVDKAALVKSTEQITQLQQVRSQTQTETGQLRESLSRLQGELQEAETGARKFQALQIKYKQKQARHGQELLVLQSDIVKLKTTNLLAARQLRQLGGHLPEDGVGAAPVDNDAEQRLSELMSLLEKRESEVQSLERQLGDEDRLRDDTSIRIRKAEQEIETLRSELREKTARLQRTEDELQDALQTGTSLNQALEEQSAQAAEDIQQISLLREHAQKKLDNALTEFNRERNTLQGRISRLEQLEAINQNQASSILRLEHHLKSRNELADQSRQHETEAVRLRTETETLEHRLTQANDQIRELQKQLDTQRDQTNQLSFEAQKVSQLKKRLNEKDEALGSLQQRLDDQDNAEQRIRLLEHMVEEERLARQSLTEKLNQARLSEAKLLDKSHQSPERLALLEANETLEKKLEKQTDALEAQETQISRLQQIRDQFEETRQRLGERNARIAGLIAEIERLKSVQIDLRRSDNKRLALESAVADLQSREAELGAEVEQQQQTIQGYKQSVQQLNRTVNEFRQHANQAVEKLKQEKSRSEATTARVTQTEKRLAERHAEINALNAELAHLSTLKNTLSTREAAVERLEARLSETGKDHAAQIDTINEDHRQAIAELVGKLADATQQLSERNQQIAKLESSLADSDDQREQNNARFANLTRKLAGQYKGIENLKRKLAAAGKAQRSSVQAARSANQQLSRLSQSGSQHEQAIENLKNKLAEANQLLSSRELQLTGLQQKLDHATRSRDDIDTGLQRLKDKLLQTSNRLSEKDQTIEILSGKLSATEHSLNGHARGVENLQRKLHMARKTASEQSATLADLEKRLKAADQKIAQHDSATLELDEQLQTTGNRLAERDQTLEQQTLKLEKHQAEVSELQSRLAQHDDDRRQAQSEIKAMKATLVQLRTAEAENRKKLLEASATESLYQDAESRLESLTEKLEDKQQTIDELNSKLATQHRQLETLRLLESELLEQQAENTALKSQGQETAQLRKQISDYEKTLARHAIQQQELQKKVHSLRESVSHWQAVSEKDRKALSALRANQKKAGRTADKSVRPAATPTGEPGSESHEAVDGDVVTPSRVGLPRQLADQLRQRDRQVESMQRELSTLRSEHEDVKGLNLSIKRLQSEVESLTRERNLGLERVRELSTQSRQLQEREQQIRQLRTELSDNRINDREVAQMRKRMDRMDTEINQKNSTIDDLRRMLNGNTPAFGVGRFVPSRTPKRENGYAGDARDDLKKIRGIGPKLEKLLNQHGITRIQQIASLSATDIQELSEKLEAFPGRIERDGWVESARELIRKA